MTISRLLSCLKYAKITNRDILDTSLLPASQEARDHKEVESMNKYELSVVLSAKLEDEERAAALEKVKGYVTRFGGTVRRNWLTRFRR